MGKQGLELESGGPSRVASRFELIIPPFIIDKLQVMLIGCGAVGSYLGVILAKMGVQKLVLYDTDIVEEENVGVQLYDMGDIDDKKADALKERIHMNSTLSIDTLDRNVRKRRIFKESARYAKRDVAASDIVVTCVDNLAARRTAWKLFKQVRTAEPRLYVDPRMGPHNFEVWVRSTSPKGGFDEGAYTPQLRGDIPPRPCGTQATPFAAPVLAGVVAATIAKWLVGEEINCVMGDLHSMQVYPTRAQLSHRLKGVQTTK